MSKASKLKKKKNLLWFSGLIHVLFLIAVLTCSTLYAQGNTDDKNQISSNSTSQVRYFDQVRIDSLKAQPEFDYITLRYSPMQIVDLILAWLWYNFLRHIFNPQTAVFWEIAAYLLAILTIVFIVRRLMKSKLSTLFYSTSQSPQAMPALADENIHQLNLQEMFEDFVKHKKYREAVRTLYLIALKNLSDGGFIKWRIGKTNSEYSSEINDNEVKNSFNRLTLFFEYVWYGEFAINDATFKSFSDQFETLKKQSVGAA